MVPSQTGMDTNVQNEGEFIMNFHGKDIKIFTANSNPMVAKRIAECLGLPLGKSEVSTFSDGEIAVSLFESVRGSDCFIVQSTCSPVNNNIMELLIMIDAMKRASAARITAVIPYFATPGRTGRPRPGTDLRQAGGGFNHHRWGGPGG